MSMDMESDLGIDSIKRVEILGAMQEQHPELPEVNPSRISGTAYLATNRRPFVNQQLVPCLRTARLLAPIVEPTTAVPAPTPASNLNVEELAQAHARHVFQRKDRLSLSRCSK